MSFDSNKILFVHNGPLFQSSSGHYYGVSMNNSLKNRYLTLGGHITFLMRKRVLEKGSEQYSLIEEENFSFIRLPEIMSFRTRIKNLRKANEIVRNAVNSHDIVVVRLPSAAGNLAVKHCVQMKKPYLVEFVACGFDALWNYNWKGKLLAPIMFLLQRRRMKKVPFVVYVTKRFLQSRYPSDGRQTNISNVELEELSQHYLEERLARIDSWDGTRKLVLGTVAAIDVPYKGQADVIKAIGKLKAQGVNVDYRLVGRGNPEQLAGLISRLGLDDQVHIVGTMPHLEIFRFLQEIDIYIQPSRQEGLPRAVIEAMSMGCPVLGAATGGIPELIDRERIFRKGRPNEIVALIHTISNKNTMRSDAVRNFEEAHKYDKKLLEKKRNDFYREFLVYHDLTPRRIEEKEDGKEK